MDETEEGDGGREAIRNPQALFERLVTADDAVHQVIEWMLAGFDGHQILQAIVAKIPDRKPAELIIEAGKYFERTAKADIDLIHGWTLEATRDVYRRLMEIGDYPNALKAIKQMRDLSK